MTFAEPETVSERLRLGSAPGAVVPTAVRPHARRRRRPHVGRTRVDESIWTRARKRKGETARRRWRHIFVPLKTKTNEMRTTGHSAMGFTPTTMETHTKNYRYRK